MALILVRHTRVDLPAGTCYGQADVPLLQPHDPPFDGVGQRLRALLARIGAQARVGAVVCSPLSRARLLAQHLAADHGQTVAVDPRWMELHFGAWEGRRFAAVSHLLSVSRNWRLRVRVFAPEDDFPVVPTLNDIWPAVNWFEREAFDLYGIMFSGHPDLRRILTDYGFIGHPFRKDFPVSGYVEMRYDPDQGRVVYQPITIEPRENTPRIIREENYGNVGHG